jgi:hypothetical protein
MLIDPVLPALWACTICEVVIFTLAGSIVYSYTGNQYVAAPAVGSLQPIFKKIAFSFAIPTIIYLGSLYSVCGVHTTILAYSDLNLFLSLSLLVLYFSGCSSTLNTNIPIVSSRGQYGVAFMP